MTRYLLDSHAFVWIVTNDAQLSARARRCFTNPANEFSLSIASVWELAIKASLGRLLLFASLADLLREHLEAKRIELLPIHMPHALRVATLPFHHRDPFDRLLAAQALHERLKVLSRDSAFDAYGVERVW